ncbi:MAG: hypothetical protein ACI8RD_014057 [Bacillariaceae sp.]|jgi:hypothetical protein
MMVSSPQIDIVDSINMLIGNNNNNNNNNKRASLLLC